MRRRKGEIVRGLLSERTPQRGLEDATSTPGHLDYLCALAMARAGSRLLAPHHSSSASTHSATPSSPTPSSKQAVPLPGLGVHTHGPLIEDFGNADQRCGPHLVARIISRRDHSHKGQKIA